VETDSHKHQINLEKNDICSGGNEKRSRQAHLISDHPALDYLGGDLVRDDRTLPSHNPGRAWVVGERDKVVQVAHFSVHLNLHRIEKEMARRCLHLVHPIHLEVVALPVEVAHLLHPLGAFEGSGEPECFLPCLQMLSPQRHSEHVDLPIRVVAAELRLPTADRHLSISSP